ncbi:MAG: FtsX-like permease family protein, partial [Candidatus Saccharibacteria bacterium]
FRYEAAWIGFLGGLVGSGLAVLLGILVNPGISKALELENGMSILIFSLDKIIFLILGLMLVAIIAGWFPSRKASRLDPIEALRTE